MTPVSVIVAPFPVSAPGPVACEPGVPGTPAQRVEGARGCQSDGLGLPRPLLLAPADWVLAVMTVMLTPSWAREALAPASSTTVSSTQTVKTDAKQSTLRSDFSLT